MATGMRLVRHAALLAWKDLVVELRTREIVYTITFFAVVVVLVFSFAFVSPGAEDPLLKRTAEASGLVPVSISGGIIWVAVAMAGTMALSRAFGREREHDTMRALLLAPVDRGAVLLGKAMGIVVFMVLVEACLVPIAGLLFNAPIGTRPLELIALLVLTTVGFATVGVTFAAMLMRSRAREMLLPVMLYPVVLPAFIAGVKGTSALWAGTPELAVAAFWIKFLVVFDLVFLSTALWAFESLVVE
jgi:heme exporter protein B